MITKTRNMEYAAEIVEMQASEIGMQITEVRESSVDLEIVDQVIPDRVGDFESEGAKGAAPGLKARVIALLGTRILALESWLSWPPMTDHARVERKLREARLDRWFLYH